MRRPPGSPTIARLLHVAPARGLHVAGVCVLLAGLLWSCLAAAAGLPVPPRQAVSTPYLSTALLLDPCLKSDAWGDDAQVRKALHDARAPFSRAACTDAAFAKDIFVLRFLQYVGLARANLPMAWFDIVERQDRALAGCRDVACEKRLALRFSADLQGRLDSPVAAPQPVPWGMDVPAADGTCADLRAAGCAALIERLGKAAAARLVDACADTAVDFSTRRQGRDDLLVAGCSLDGSNAVNSDEWRYLVHAGVARLLLHVDEGPAELAGGTCNGMPNLVTRARMNMGESDVMYYRYDGARYRSVFGYNGTAVSYGSGEDASALVAQYAGRVDRVACR